MLAHGLALLGYRKILVYERDLDVPPAPLAATGDLTCGWLAESKIDELARARPDIPRTKWKDRLARGDRCWVARQDGRIVSSRWVTRGPATVKSTGVHCNVPAGYGYVHDSFTSPDVRGRRIGPAAGMRLASTLASEGVRTLLAFVEAGNHWAVRNAENAGYRQTGSLVKLAVWKWILPVRRNTALNAHIERKQP